jgi:hypothetical protein
VLSAEARNKKVFNRLLKTLNVIPGSFRNGGSLFQVEGPAWKNPRVPIVTVDVFGTIKVHTSADRNYHKTG